MNTYITNNPKLDILTAQAKRYRTRRKLLQWCWALLIGAILILASLAIFDTKEPAKAILLPSAKPSITPGAATTPIKGSA